MERFVTFFDVEITHAYHRTLDKINRPSGKQSLLNLRALPDKFCWLID
jgi:hypothetical protein